MSHSQLFKEIVKIPKKQVRYMQNVKKEIEITQAMIKSLENIISIQQQDLQDLFTMVNETNFFQIKNEITIIKNAIILDTLNLNKLRNKMLILNSNLI